MERIIIRHGSDDYCARCKCGRYPSLAEAHANNYHFLYYECPDCAVLSSKGIYTIEQYNQYLKAIKKNKNCDCSKEK